LRDTAIHRAYCYHRLRRVYNVLLRSSYKRTKSLLQSFIK